MQDTENTRNEVRFEFNFGNDRIQESATRKVVLKADEDDLPHISASFIDWMDSIGFPPEILSVFLVSSCISQSENGQECLENISETVDAVQGAFAQFEGGGTSEEGESKGKTVNLEDYIDKITQGAKDNPVRKVMDFEQFVGEFQKDDAFRRYMYMLYTGEVTE